MKTTQTVFQKNEDTYQLAIEWLIRNPEHISEVTFSIQERKVVLDIPDYYHVSIGYLPRSIYELVRVGYISLFSWRMVDDELFLIFKKDGTEKDKV